MPEWSTFAAQRRRTLLFLIFAAICVAYQMIVPADWFMDWTGIDAFHGRGWVAYPLFSGDRYFFGGDPPPWYETLYRWFLTLLPLAAWVAIIFFVLTRRPLPDPSARCIARCRSGLIFLEGDMRWFQMSQKHVSWNDILAAFDVHASADLGLHSSEYEEIAWQFAYHLLFLASLAFLAGPEPRWCVQAIWNGPSAGPMPGSSADGCYRAIVKLRLEAALFGVLGWLDSKAAFACLAAADS